MAAETGWPRQKPSASLRGRSWWWYQPWGSHRPSKTLACEQQELFYCSRNILTLFLAQTFIAVAQPNAEEGIKYGLMGHRYDAL